MPNAPFKFVETICARRPLHCRICRSSERWRRTQLSSYQMPAGGIEVCPFGVTLASLGAAPAAPAPIPYGPELWKIWHQRGKRMGILKADADIAAFMAWSARVIIMQVPCNDCKVRWRKWIMTNAPKVGQDAFEWTVTAHDAVNLELQKPAFGIEKAKALYQ